MQQLIRINEIRVRADKIGISLKALCRAAGREHSTVYRWVNGETDPGLTAYAETCEALEHVLIIRERQVLEHLTTLHPRSAA